VKPFGEFEGWSCVVKLLCFSFTDGPNPKGSVRGRPSGDGPPCDKFRNLGVVSRDLVALELGRSRVARNIRCYFGSSTAARHEPLC
jgi:hypothetical protein